MRKPSKLILRLCKKIQDDLGYECDEYSFRRTYAGYWQRSLGAWSWYMRTKSGVDIGSMEPVTECVKKKYKLIKSGQEIYIEQKTKEV